MEESWFSQDEEPSTSLQTIPEGDGDDESPPSSAPKSPLSTTSSFSTTAAASSSLHGMLDEREFPPELLDMVRNKRRRDESEDIPNAFDRLSASKRARLSPPS